MNAVDTNVLIYALDADEPTKQVKAQMLLDRLVPRHGETELLWQVAAEFLSCLRKWQSAGRISAEDVEANFRDITASFPLRLPVASVFTVSFDLSSRYSLSHWDSLLVAGCKEAGIGVLYTEDLDAGTDYDGVQIINPFV
jgi:predicted nucleic acid-binding protein